MEGRAEEIPLTENPAFDGTYDTFQAPGASAQRRNTAESGPDHHSVDTSRDFQVSVGEDPNLPSQAGQLRAELNEISSEMLTDELPSATLRKVKGLARPGSVRHRETTQRPADADDDSTAHFVIAGSNSPEFGRDGLVHRSISRMPSHQLEVEDFDEFDAARVNRMTVDMRTKKSIRRQASRVVQPKTISRWKQFKYACSLKSKMLKNSIKDSFAYIDLWHSHLRKVQGTFGSGVLSYFTLLRWLFGLNLLITVMNLLFLFVPQIVHDRSTKHNNATFSGLELLTGEGWFDKTELYYGGYTNASIPVKGSTPYRMPLAYLCVGGGYLLLCLLVLLRSMTKSYRDNFITGGDTGGPIRYFTKVFSSWDYAIVDSSASLLKMKSIYNDLLETLGESRRKDQRTREDICILVIIRLITNLVVLGLLAGSVYIILYVASGSVKVDTSFLQDMLPAIVISSLNLVIPFAFRIVASLEQYRLPQTELTVSLARTIILKLASISVYVVALHKDITCSVHKSASCKQIDCWETFVGAAFYKLVLVDFVFLLIAVFFGEFVRRLLAVCIPAFRERFGLPGFDISRNVLDLIYSQGICWLGTFYSPLLPLVNVIKLFLLFYVKRFSVMANCRPSMRPFNASKMNLLFLVLLGSTLLLAMIVIGYVIINDGDLKPSAKCGPFRGRETIYSVVIEVIDNDIPDVLEDIIESIASAGILVAITFLLGLLAYYFKLKKSSSAKKIKLLKDQIALAGRDKVFLIRKLRLMMSESGYQHTASGGVS